MVKNYNINVKLNPEAGKLLDKYVGIGLYGSTKEEVAEHILREGLVAKLDILIAAKKELKIKK